MKNIARYCVFAALFSGVCLAQSEIPASFTETTSYSDLWQKGVVAIVAAIFGFLGNYVLAHIKAKKESHKEISYDISVRKGLVTDGEKISDKVKILYDGKLAENLYHVEINVKNSGNTVVKNEQLRFNFGSGTRVVDNYFDPEPERELGVKENPDQGLQEFERQYLISHLERARDVQFRFIISGKIEPKISIHDFNESGDVSFIPRLYAGEENNRYHVVSFLRLLLLYYIVPPVFYLVPIGDISESAASVLRLGLLIFMVPHITKVISIVSDALLRFVDAKDKESNRINVSAGDASTFYINGASINNEAKKSDLNQN